MSRLKEELDSASALIERTSPTLNSFLERIKFPGGKLIEEIAELEQQKEQAQRELEEWLAKLKAAEQEHRQREQSIASLKAQMNELLKKLDVRAA